MQETENFKICVNTHLRFNLVSFVLRESFSNVWSTFRPHHDFSSKLYTTRLQLLLSNRKPIINYTILTSLNAHVLSYYNQMHFHALFSFQNGRNGWNQIVLLYAFTGMKSLEDAVLFGKTLSALPLVVAVTSLLVIICHI